MVDSFLIGDYRNFIYLITVDGQSLVVDPQSDLKPWQARMRELGSRLTGVLLTHTHWDHVAGLPAIAKEYAAADVPIYVHELDAHRLSSAKHSGSARSVAKPAAALEDRFHFVCDGDRISIGSQALEVLHTPGHSAGECCYLLRDHKPPALFTGDTVFVGDVGRCDLESGSVSQMYETIQRLKTLPPNTVIYPGHDYGRTPTSTLQRERDSSPAFACRSVEELDALP